MTSPALRRRPLTSRVGAVVAVLAALLVALVPLLVSAPGARAAVGPQVTIALSKVSPETVPAKADAEITIEGTVTNTSKAPMNIAQVAFWRSKDPIPDESSLAQTLASPWDSPTGSRMGSNDEDPEKNLFNLTAEGKQFMPGQKVAFRVSAKVGMLQLGEGEGVRLLGVHVRAQPVGDINQTVGRARVLMPMASTVKRSTVATAVVLTSRPTQVAQGQFIDDHLAAELNGGRLARLLELAERTGTTVLMDPSLFDELTQMSKGYTLVDGRPGTGKEQARAWLERFGALRALHPVYRLPYGDPDLLGAAHSGNLEVREAVAAAMPDNHPLSGLPLAVVPLDGHADQTLLDYLKPLSPDLVITSMNGLPTRSTASGITVVNAAPQLFGGGPGPSPSDSTPQVVGRMLSQLTLSSDDTFVAVVSEPRASTLAALGQVPSGSSLIGGPQRTIARLPDLPRPPALDARVWSSAQRTAQQIRQWGSLTSSKDAARQSDEVIARSLNVRFDRDQGAILQWLVRVEESVPDLRRVNVRLVTAPSFVVNSDKADLPVTVVNQEKVPIRVKVVFTSENSQRISLPDTGLVTIAADESKTVTFRTDSHGNGAVKVTAQLVTADGDPVAQPKDFTVTATSLGRVGWLVIIASGAVVIGATVLRIKQVQRERSKQAELDAVPPPPSPEFPTDHDLHGRPHP